ncbi:MAG: ABC transporter ATP-binding protein [Chitinophagales bacterium]
MRITLIDVTKRFGRTEALKEANLTINDGEFFTLLGPSGCGKTTTLRIIAGFHKADEGEVLFDERRMNDEPPSRRNIGIVFQNLALWPHMTVKQNIAYGLRLRRVPKAEIDQRIVTVLDKVGLAGFQDRYPGQLSGGQQQRVALARALVLNPGVLLLDEPLSSLDAKVRLRLRTEIRKLQQELRITTVCVTHDQEEALTMSDRIAVMNEGRVLQVGTPRDLYERPTSVFVADFVGANNMLRGQSRPAAGEIFQVETAAGLIAGVTSVPTELEPGQPAVAAFRPETGLLVEREISEQERAELNLLRGRVAFFSYMGNTLRYEVEIAGGVSVKLDVRDPGRHTLHPIGSEVVVAFPVRSTLVIPDPPAARPAVLKAGEA